MNRVLADWRRTGRIGDATAAAVVVPVWMRTLDEIWGPFEAGGRRVAGLELPPRGHGTPAGHGDLRGDPAARGHLDDQLTGDNLAPAFYLMGASRLILVVLARVPETCRADIN